LGLGVAVLGASIAGAQASQSQLPTLPLVQLDERALAPDLDNRAFTLTFAQPVPIRDLLLLLVRGTGLSIVPDPAVNGTFIGEIKNVTVRQALGLILPPLGLDHRVDGAFIRVFRREPETRLFNLNYLATTRTGSTRVGGMSPGGSSATIESTSSADVFADIANGLRTLLSEGAAFNVDRKAGLLQVTDFPERLDRVSLYLDTVHERVHRQVQIDVRVVEVELGDVTAQSLDWDALAQPRDATPGAASRPSRNGLRVTDVSQFLAGLQAQGRVSLIAAPRVIALNNEPALVRAASEAPGAKAGQRPALGSVTLEVTPQIAGEGAIMLSVSPIVTVQEADTDDASAVTVIRESDTLARIADGETLVLGGFTRERETRERRNAGVRGGWFGRSTVVTRKRLELVILLTPKILVEF
jgi:type II secretory pathway component GspD/PulD (secretin)